MKWENISNQQTKLWLFCSIIECIASHVCCNSVYVIEKGSYETHKSQRSMAAQIWVQWDMKPFLKRHVIWNYCCIKKKIKMLQNHFAILCLLNALNDLHVAYLQLALLQQAPFFWCIWLKYVFKSDVYHPDPNHINMWFKIWL